MVPQVESRMTRDRYQQYQSLFDRTPTEVFDERCAALPAKLRSAEWDLKKRFRKELATARKRPLGEVMAGTTSTPAP